MLPSVALPNTGTLRDEIELMLRELERFIAATDLKIKPAPTPERQDAFRKIPEDFRGTRRKPQ